MKYEIVVEITPELNYPEREQKIQDELMYQVLNKHLLGHKFSDGSIATAIDLGPKQTWLERLLPKRYIVHKVRKIR